MSTETMPFLDAIPVRAICPGMPFPFVIVAYYPRGGWWKVHPEMFASPDTAANAIEDLSRRGWAHIQIVKLP